MTEAVTDAKPLFIQQDCTVLLDTNAPLAEQARYSLLSFAELVKSPDGWHTYKITSLSLWQACAGGMDAGRVCADLDKYGRYGVPSSLQTYIERTMGRYGSLTLTAGEPFLHLTAADWRLLKEISDIPTVQAYLRGQLDPVTVAVDPGCRGDVKRELQRAGFPVIDTVGYNSGNPLAFRLREGDSFRLRDYQLEAVDRFCRDGEVGGSGVIVLPCGAGKTVVGIAAAARLQCETLILTTNLTSVHQWKRELLEKTTLTAEQIGEYGGRSREVKPVTIGTYHILAARSKQTGLHPHMQLFNERDWGLIIYDEVHLLPAPVFRLTAQIQATRRLGLTATLVREDGREHDVFSLIGPKRYELQWKSLEESGHIAAAVCREVEVALPPAERQNYAQALKRHKHRIAGENAAKLEIVRRVVAAHSPCRVIVIGQYLEQLRHASRLLGAPVITGEMPQNEREQWYEKFRSGEIRLLIVSKVANFAVDLPGANVAVQISGSFGSRQEEAQRLGRILRAKPGDNAAYFYSLVTSDSCELEFARNRQLFLTEQGYSYEKLNASSIGGQEVVSG